MRGCGAVSEIFDNKNCHTAPPAHLLTRTPHTSCAKNLDHCLELLGKQRQWNWDDDGTKDTGTFPLLHNLVQNCVLEYSGKCRVCVLYLVTGVGYPGLLKSLGLIYDFRHRMPHSSTNRVAKRSFQGHDGAFFSEVTSRDIQFTLSAINCFLGGWWNQNFKWRILARIWTKSGFSCLHDLPNASSVPTTTTGRTWSLDWPNSLSAYT